MAEGAVSPAGPRVPAAQMFGWVVVAFLAAFLIDDLLLVLYDFPGASAAFAGGGILAIVQLALYVVAIAAALAFVQTSRQRSLLDDSAALNRLNAYLVRGAFFAVLFVGLADVFTALMRVEEIFPPFFSEDLQRALVRSNYVGPVIHLPLVALGFLLAAFVRTLGFPWLAMLIVIAEFVIVVSRFVFSYEQAFMADLVRYWYAALFLFAAAYTLLHEGHVRVDIVYAGLSPRKKALVNGFGSVFFGLTTVSVVLAIGLSGPNGSINGPVSHFEATQAGSSGMYVKYQMAAFLGFYAATMTIQFTGYFLAAVHERITGSDEVPHLEAPHDLPAPQKA